MQIESHRFFVQLNQQFFLFFEQIKTGVSFKKYSPCRNRVVQTYIIPSCRLYSTILKKGLVELMLALLTGYKSPGDSWLLNRGVLSELLWLSTPIRHTFLTKKDNYT